MSPWRLALIFTVLSVTLLACFPCVLRVAELGWVQLARRPQQLEHLAAVVARHPQDPETRFGYALAAQRRVLALEFSAEVGEVPQGDSLENASRSAEAAWQEAIRTPGSGPAPRVIRALYLLDKSLPDRPRQGYGNPKWRPVPLTPKQRQDAAAVVTLLREAVVQDPRNAWPRYLLAVAYLTQRQDEAAWQAVRAAEQAPGWDSYAVSARKALCRLYHEGGEPLALARANTSAFPPESLAGPPSRELGRLLRYRADGLRTEGQHAEALSAYESLLLYCRRLRQGAMTVCELLWSWAIVPMATEQALPAEARSKLLPFNQTQEGRDATRLSQAMAFACYATVHDRPDVGALAVTETRTSSRLHDEVSTALDNANLQSGAPAMGLAYRVRELLLCELPFVLQVSLAWLPPLAAALWRRRRLATTSMRCGQWLWPLGATLMAASILRFWDPLSGVLFPDDGPLWAGSPLNQLYCALSALIWPAALTLAAWLAVRRAVAAAPDAPRPSVAATAALHAVPALAALLLLTVLALGVWYAVLDAWSVQEWRLVEQGTLHVLGITGY